MGGQGSGRQKYKLPVKKELDAIKRFQSSIDMKALRLFLEEQDVPKYQTLFGMMCDPEYQKLNFSTLMKRAHVSITDIQQIYTDGMRHIALLHMMNSLPQIMSDVADDAKNSTQTCPRCDGLMVIPFGENGTRPCPNCEGAGSIEKKGDKHARDLVFESAKLVKQSGPLVALQTNIQIGDSKLESMLKRTRQIVLEKPAEKIETIDHGSIDVERLGESGR